MRYVAVAMAFCFLLAPLEAKTFSNGTHVVKMKKTKVKGRKAAKRSQPRVRRVTSSY
ncbi:MAG: hypothetical protein M3N54_08045 [Acidobacteriota bacterium]|nr:hypothetical protein [Acidobacteriota bacterium]